jgi:hypothetical protein
MKKVYLLAFSDSAAKRDQMAKFLDKIPEVITWRYDLPNAIYVVSEADAGVLTKKLRELTADKGRFIFSEIGTNRNGWLTPESWYLIENKTHKPKTA